jgi:hypothetical protein
MNPCTKPTGGIYIEASFNIGDSHIPFHLLIDCVATVSLLSKSTYESLPAGVRPPLKMSMHRVKFADGRLQHCSRLINTPLRVGDCVKEIQFLVGDFTDEAILGMRDLQLLGLSIDFDTFTVTKDNWWIPVFDSSSNAIAKQVTVRKAVTLPPRSEVIVPASVSQKGEKNTRSDQRSCPAYLEPTPTFVRDYGILPAKSLHSSDSSELPILVCNPTFESIVIEPNTIVGRLVDVDHVSDPIDVDQENEFGESVGLRNCSDISSKNLMKNVLFQMSCLNM